MSNELTFDMLMSETLLNWKRRALYAEGRARHMDELVEAVDVALSLLNFNKDYGTIQTETVRVTVDPIRTIIAKIKGEKA
jgi:hypothetical protein